MPLVEQYPNWVQLEPVTDTQTLVDCFYNNSSAWQQRPMQSFFAECSWYKFPYCCAVPWYKNLNIKEIIGNSQTELYNNASRFFEHINTQLGNDFVFWGAELNSVPPGAVIKPHTDRHFYSDYATRVHVVLDTNENVIFEFENIQHHFKTGECFIFNNKLKHSIKNTGTTNRLHLVADFVPKNVFQYVERSISPFGGHEGNSHILSHLHASDELYKNYICKVDGKEELYPYLTKNHVG